MREHYKPTVCPKIPMSIGVTIICGILPDSSAYISRISNSGDKDGGKGHNKDNDESEGKNDDLHKRLIGGGGFTIYMSGCA